MKFALFNQLQMPGPWRQHEEVLMYKEAITEAVHAEAVEFDAYWQTEHHFYTEIGHSSAPEIVLAAISQRTSRLRLGLGVVVLPCNHPYRVVEYVSTLDVVSDGRVEFGTGRGASPYHVGRDIAGAAGRWYFGDNQAALQTQRFDGQALLRLSNEELIAEGLIVGGDPDYERQRCLGTRSAQTRVA